MSNSTRRDGDFELLHPAIRDRVKAIRSQLHKEKIPFEIFEAFRTPERQADLYAKGRTKPGRKVTWVGPWRSIHQYGLAVDFVLKPAGGWSWDDTGDKAKWWTRMHELAQEHGMTPLYNSKGRLIEAPHIQLKGVSTKDLCRGVYPEGGDAAWAERLSELIANWRGDGAPPRPDATPERPPLDADVIAELEEDPGEAAAQSGSPPATDGDARFSRLHDFVKRWEGGFADHPRDKGGATNMGITIGTLARHRGRDVTVEDVRTLSRSEADAIFRKDYYTANRCGEMPERMAMVVYNASVLSGCRRAVEFAQKAFNSLGMTANGAPLDEDGVLGRITMAAIRETDATVLSQAFMDQQETYLRAHDDFDVFGVGWLNRMAALREFVDTLQRGAGKRPKNVATIASPDDDTRDAAGDSDILDLDDDDLLPILLTLREKGRRAAGRALRARIAQRRAARRNSTEKIADLLIREVALNGLDTDDMDIVPAVPPIVGKAEKPPLTPVNAALGETIGHAMNGKKSVTGILGLLLTVFLSENGIAEDGTASEVFGQLGLFFANYGTELTALFGTLTGWGFLGKIDKAIRAVRLRTGSS